MKMKVRMRTQYAGPSGNAGPGQEIDLDNAEALALLNAGYADPVKDQALEQAVQEPAETETQVAATPRRTSRRKPHAGK